MPLPQITVRQLKDGRPVARFRDAKGLVRTRVGINEDGGFVRAEQVKKVADYGITLQIAQARAGLGSNGLPLPPLKESGRSLFVARENGRVRFARKTYASRKSAKGLQPVRDLYGFGNGGHMLDAIRVNYLDDKRATIAITSKVSRDKARGNERRTPWWGWSPASIAKLRQRSAEIFGTGVAERLFELGLIGVSALAFAKARVLRRVA